MPTWVTVILEIIKITVPALIVFCTVYFVLKEFLDKQYHMKMLDYRQNQQKITLPMRLQAYERLTLMCERIFMPNLIRRIRTESMTTADLNIAAMIAIQQEFEHNIAQQVYVSPDLWSIIKLAKNDSYRILNEVAKDMDPKSSSIDYSKALFQYLDQQPVLALDRALLAIKKEAGLLL